jgi:oxygen-independent coproporphyrinogen-3 oxidase
MTSSPEAFGVYVHWPYCARICPYCDFNVRKNRAVDEKRWANAFVRELQFWSERTPGRRLASLYFGGGTPSLAPVGVIAGVIDAAEQLWGFTADPEISLEANPTDAELSRFAGFAAAGVNRLSLGVQSFNDAALKFLGRNHDADAGRRAIAAAQGVFPRISIDLIYALPGQGIDQWTDELRIALASGVGHLSPYQLTIEEGTAFGRQVGKRRWAPADDGRAADLFDLTQDLCAAAGLPAYEISNHAAPGEESRHNQLYWRQGDYLGVGPGAHGRVTVDGARRETEAEPDPGEYLERVEREGVGAILDHPLTEEEARVEKFAMGLRTAEGAAIDSRDRAALAARLAPLLAEGLLTETGGRLIAPPDARRILDSVLARLFA